MTTTRSLRARAESTPAMNSTGMPGHLIRRLHQRSTHVFALRIQEAGFDLTQVQFAAMDAIRSRPGVDQAGVATRIGYDRATIGGVIDRLEQKGLVRREVSPQDRRARAVYLTRDGERLFASVLPLVRSLQSEILERLDAQEQADLLALAHKAIGPELADGAHEPAASEPVR